jgi:hypothetical protein
MSDHKFKIGETVTIIHRFPRLGQIIYQIVSRMPAERGEPRYRIKSATEAHERVVGEGELRAVTIPIAPAAVPSRLPPATPSTA